MGAKIGISGGEVETDPLGFALAVSAGSKKGEERGATEDEIAEAMVYAMRPAAAKVRDLAKAVIAQ